MTLTHIAECIRDMEKVFGRVLRTGLSSLRDRAAARLAALRFNPSRRDLRFYATLFALVVSLLFGRHGIFR